MFAHFYPRTPRRVRLPRPTRKMLPTCRPCLEHLEDRSLMAANVVLDWNLLTLEAIGQTRSNPLIGSRALAITQLAVYDAVNAIDGSHAPYAFTGNAPPGAPVEAAAAVAAHTALVELFPTRQAVFDAALESSLAAIPDGPAEKKGAAIGRAAAHTILSLRRHDGFDEVVLYTAGTEPGDWQPTPPLFVQQPLGPHWPDVTPFAMTAGSQFRPPPPPELDSEEYAAAFDEVHNLGGNGTTTPTVRDAEQTEIARFWGGATGTSFAFGHWNLIAQVAATQEGLGLVADAHLLAVLNIATADAIISCWDAKYEYDFWRPVTAIRAGAADGTPDKEWTPLLITPNFPSYTSAHSTVSGSAATVLTSVFGSDYQFTVGSEGLPGTTRFFESFDEAATEAGESRIYGGIHFRFDCEIAQEAGVNLGDYVLDNFLLSLDDDALTAVTAAPAPVNESLRANQVPSLLNEALARWQAAGIDTSALQGIDVRIVDLGGLTLGRAGDGVIWLDDNAAGWGWFVDETPWEDSEFSMSGDQGEEGRMDLLTVLEHEVGHLLGREHEVDGVMQQTLSAGSRRSVIPFLEPDSRWLSAALTGWRSEEAVPWISTNEIGRGSKRV